MMGTMLASAFGATAAFTVGAEEELLLVEPDTYDLAHESLSVLAAMALPSDIAHAELYASVLEFASVVSENAGDAVETLTRLRRAARKAGATAIGAGVHPAAVAGDAAMLGGERYRYIKQLLGSPALRTPECALHVHVGMPDPETAVVAYNGLRPYTPLLEALASNSPFIHGVDSGFASGRGFQMRRYPRFEIPRAFADYEDYATAIEATMAAADIVDPSLVWWRLRLHPRLGTVEIRVMDSQSDLGMVAGLVALTHGLVAAAVDDGRPGGEITREALGESSYQAIRFGLEARLWHGDRTCPVRELAGQAVERARPYAAEFGSGDALGAIERIVAEGNGSDRQRAAFARHGIGGVLRFLVEDSEVG